MKWSLRIARIFGIDVFLHFTFILFLVWIGTVGLQKGGPPGALLAVGTLLAVFLCVLLHEFGHSLAARRYGIPTADITLLPIGGVARLERMPDDPKQELVVAIAGPAVNVGIALVLLLWHFVSGHQWPSTNGMVFTGDFLTDLLRFNVMMIAFNMLPAFPMDGGRVLRAMLAMRMPHARATRIAAGIGQGMAVLFGLWGITHEHYILLFIAFFVWIGASQEAADSEQRSVFAGLKVRDAMLTEFRSISPQHSARDVARFILEGWQADFPVIDSGRCVGVVTRKAVLQVYEDGDPAGPVSAFMSGEVDVCASDEPLVPALDRLRQSSQPIIPVVDTDRVVGLLTTENVMEAMLFRRAVINRAANAPAGAARDAAQT